MASRFVRTLLSSLIVGGAWLALVGPAAAGNPFWQARPRPTRPRYTFSIEDENGAALPTFDKDGRTFLLGEPGLRYQIRVSNPTPRRVEAVVSVDGRDAVSGDPGDYVNERGYVIAPYGSVVIEGFRRSTEAVAAFRFTSSRASYSARLGTPQNVGVIGVAFFPERVPRVLPVSHPAIAVPAPRPPLPNYFSGDGHNDPGQSRAGAANAGAANAGAANRDAASGDTASGEEGRSRSSNAPPSAAPSPAKSGASQSGPASAAPSRAPSFDAPGDRDRADADAPNAAVDRRPSDSVNNLGTQFGENRESLVTSVRFERASATQPALLETLRYDDIQGLSARGIDLASYLYNQQTDDQPQAFPASRFAQPPP